MKIFPRIPTKPGDQAIPGPAWIESDVVPRVGEYFIYHAPHKGKAYEIPPEVYFRIVSVAYMRGDGNQMEAALTLKRARNSPTDEIPD
jgi:hypothetical protein